MKINKGSLWLGKDWKEAIKISEAQDYIERLLRVIKK